MAGLRASGGGWSGRLCGHVEGSRAGSARGNQEECGVEPACIGSGPARRKGWGRRGAAREGFRGTLSGIATEESLPRGSCHVFTARYLLLAVGDSPAPSHAPSPSASVGFLEPGIRLAVWGGGGGSRLRGARASNPGLPEAGACPGAAEPARLFAGGREGGSGRCPLNSGKPAIAEVGRAGRPFFQEWVETFGAYSPGALQTQARVPSSRLGWLTKPNSRPRGDPVARGPEPALCRRGGWSRARHPPRPGPPPATPPPSSTLGTSVGRNNLFLETAAMKLFVTREGRVQSYKLLEGRTGFFPLGSLPAAVSRGACGTK